MYASVSADEYYAGVVNSIPTQVSFPVEQFAPVVFPSLRSEPYIRFNLGSDPSWKPEQLSKFVANLQNHFETLPRDPYAELSNNRFRQYSRAIVLPWMEPLEVHWLPGHIKDGEEISYYNQGKCLSFAGSTKLALHIDIGTFQVCSIWSTTTNAGHFQASPYA